jgi:hypothetical protein
MMTTMIAFRAMNIAVIGLFQGARRTFPASVRGAAGAATIGIVVLCSTPVRAADFGVPEPVKTSRPATMDVSDVKARIKSIYHAYRAIKVRYVQDVRHDSPSSKHIPKMRYTYAYKGEKRLKEEQATTGRPEQDGTSYTFAFNGNVQQQYCNEPSQLTIYERKESFADIDAYITVLGIPLQNTERATASKNPQLLPGCLDIGEWHVLPMLQLIDDQECHVLVSSMGHRIWVDSALGVIRFRETSVPAANSDAADWPLNERFYYSQFTECGDGIRLPELVKVDSFSSTRASEHKLARQHVLDVEEIHVNDDVPAELFTLTVPDGTIVNDMINKKFFKVGDPESGLDRLVNLKPKESAGTRTMLLWINAAVIALLAAWFIGRRFFRAS